MRTIDADSTAKNANICAKQSLLLRWIAFIMQISIPETDIVIKFIIAFIGVVGFGTVDHRQHR